MFGYLCVHVLRRKGRAIRGIAPNYRTISRTRGPSGSKYPGYSSGESPARPPAPEDDVKIGAALHRALQLLRFLSPARIAPFGGGLSGIASPLPAQARQGAGSRCLAQQNSLFFSAAEPSTCSPGARRTPGRLPSTTTRRSLSLS